MTDTFTDIDMIVMLSSVTGAGCSLNRSPKKNWVEKDGGLPPYICAIARALVRNGHPMSSAISIAISRAKHWATAGEQGGKAVHADTRAKAAAAVAQWEALKAKAHAGNVVKASHMSENGPEEHIVYLANASQSYRMNDVSNAWEQKQAAERLASYNDPEYMNSGQGESSADEPWRYSYVTEVWTDFIIVRCEGVGPDGDDTLKVPYDVTPDGVQFGNPVPVHHEWINDDDSDDELDANDYDALGISSDSVALANSQPIDSLVKIMNLKKK